MSMKVHNVNNSLDIAIQAMSISFAIATAEKVNFYGNQECEHVNNLLIDLMNFPWALSMCQMFNIHLYINHRISRIICTLLL